MKEIIFGTQNKAKIDQINGSLQGTNFVVVGLPEGTSKLEIEENGLTAQENAHRKATAYAKILGEVVLAMDNALFFDDLPPEKQPGTKVRRFQDETRSNDGEVLLYYKNLIESFHKDEVDGHWEFGLCLANPNGTCKETTIVSPRKFVANGSAKVVEGYPLESIQKDPVTGKIISDMDTREQGEFWLREIGSKVQDFVVKNSLL